MNKIKQILSHVKKFFLVVMIRISIALHRLEDELIKSKLLPTKEGYTQTVRSRNPIFNKMLDGQRDEQFVQNFYEILKKADAFMRNSTPEQIEMAAFKWGMSYGLTDEETKNVGKNPHEKPKKDKWGRRYEHFGFFDSKHKHHGKTMAEVMRSEVMERVTKDDENQIEIMFSNKPESLGFVGNHEIVYDGEDKYKSLGMLEKEKLRKFPMRIQRDNENAINKIEQLTEYLHIKKIDDLNKIIEFLIPVKYKVFDYSEESDIFTEIIDINTVWIKDEYNNMYGYTIDEYYKRSEVIDESIVSSDDNVIYHVIKFKGKRIEKI